MLGPKKENIAIIVEKKEVKINKQNLKGKGALEGG